MQIDEILKTIKNETETHSNYVDVKLIMATQDLMKYCENKDEQSVEILLGYIESIIPCNQSYVEITLYSCLNMIRYREKYIIGILKAAFHDSEMSMYTKLYVQKQVAGMIFRHSELETIQTKILSWKLYQQVLEAFEKAVDVDLSPISIEERNHNLVLVITEQVIEYNHAPTRTALSRCKTIKERMEKDVLLINTGEVLSEQGKVLFWGSVSPEYMEEYTQINALDWEGVTIPFYQCEQGMPRLDILNQLLQEIRNLKPEFILSIGGGSILGSLANRIIGGLSLNLCFSDISLSEMEYQILAGNISDEDREILHEVGKDESHVIQSQFVADLLPQRSHTTREELGIPEDIFVIAVAGARLDYEVTEEFLEMLEEACDEKTYIVYVGNLDKYESKMKNHPSLASKSKCLGFVSDMQAVMEQIDLYVNPYRKGGGMSCVEAMIKGVPVVTIGYGDTACNVGETFWVENYEEMVSTIHRYREDKAFYNEMSEKAKARAVELVDSEAHFVKAIEEFLERREKKNCEK